MKTTLAEGFMLLFVLYVLTFIVLTYKTKHAPLSLVVSIAVVVPIYLIVLTIWEKAVPAVLAFVQAMQ